MKRLRPLDDNLLAEQLPAEEATASGIIIPETAKKKPKKATVIAVGKDESLQEIIKKGDIILYAQTSGDELHYEGKDLIMLNRADILAIEEDF